MPINKTNLIRTLPQTKKNNSNMNNKDQTKPFKNTFTF